MTRRGFTAFLTALALVVGACGEGGEPQDSNELASPPSTSPSATSPVTADGGVIGSSPLDPEVVSSMEAPHGTLLVIEERPRPFHRITALDANSMALTRRVDAPEGAILLDLDTHPDGERLVYSSLRATITDGVSNHDTADLILDSGSDSEVLLRAPDGDRHIDPVCSPNSEELFFVTARQVEDRLDARIERLVLETGERATLFEDALEPSVSGDGAQMVYIGIDPTTGSSHIMLGDLDTLQTRALTGEDDFHGVSFALFSPDDRHVYFTALRAPEVDPAAHGEHSSEADWWRIAIEGGEPEKVLAVGEAVLGAAFDPVSGALFFTTSTGAYAVTWGEDVADYDVTQLLRSRSLRAIALSP